MDTLQQLSATKFVTKFLENTKVTLSKTANSKISFVPPKTSEILHATEPLWMFAALDDSVERICFELNQWGSNNVSHLVFENETTLFLRDFQFINTLIDARKTALHLSTNESLLLDDRLILTVIYGWFEKAKEICDKNPASNFRLENAVSMYRRLAIGYITPTDVMSTVTNRVRFPMGFLMKIPAEHFTSMNFIDISRRLIVEFLYDPSLEARKLLDSFFEKSGRVVSEYLPSLVTAVIPSFLTDAIRSELLFALAIDICGEEPVRHVVEKWPGSAGFLDIDGLYLSMVRHPVLASNLIKLLKLSNFNINWQTLILLTRQNDYAVRETIREMTPEKMWWALSEQNFELFYHLCDTNARKTLIYIKDTLSKDQFETLIKSRNFSCFLIACKRGHFLAVKLLTDGLDETLWDEVFGVQSYEAFFLVTQGGYIAIVEWFGMLCSKFNMKRKYEEAHMVTVRMLELESRMLEAALESLKHQNAPV